MPKDSRGGRFGEIAAMPWIFMIGSPTVIGWIVMSAIQGGADVRWQGVRPYAAK